MTSGGSRRISRSMIAWIAGVGFVLGTFGGCVLSAVTSSPTRTDSTPTTVAAASAEVSDCVPVPGDLVSIINGQLVADYRISAPRALHAPAGVYVGGDIVAGSGTRVSSSDVWLYRDAAMYALSGSAREFSSLPDGRSLGSAGDEYGEVVQECSRQHR